jgi:hypothetical protein
MKNVSWAICFLFFAACISKNNPPRGIIQKDTMKNILWDMIQADQYSKLFLVKDSCTINVKDETIKLYQQVFQIHHITKEEFDKSYQYYLTHQDLNKLIFDSLSLQIIRERHQPNQPPVMPKLKPFLKAVKR